MGNIGNILIQLVSGGLGGYGAGKAMKKFSLGTVWDIVAGIVGGVGGGQLLNLIGIGASGGFDIGSILVSILGGGVGGGILLAIVSFVKGLIGKK